MPKQPEKSITDKTRQVWDNSNKERRQKYWHDDVYKEKIKARARGRWQSLGMGPKNLVNCADNLPNLHLIGTARCIVGYPNPVLCFTVEQAAEALGGYSPVCFRKWLQEGKMPRPIFILHNPNVPGPPPNVYTENQIIKMIGVMSDHQKYKRSLSLSDTDIIGRLQACI